MDELRKEVQRWRNDALEAAAKIAERYAEFDCASDIRALKHAALKAALAQTQGEPEKSLVERALDAWYTDGESKPYDDLQRSCMADAGRVFMEAALAEPEMREINAAFWKDDDNYASAAKRLFANRHLQILGQLESLPAKEDAAVEAKVVAAICQICGARIAYQELHAKWHDNLNCELSITLPKADAK